MLSFELVRFVGSHQLLPMITEAFCCSQICTGAEKLLLQLRKIKQGTHEEIADRLQAAIIIC